MNPVCEFCGISDDGVHYWISENAEERTACPSCILQYGEETDQEFERD